MGILYRCFMPEDFRNGPNYLRTIEDDRRDEAEARTRLWHYTKVEALYKIFANRTIRFSRIDQVNDLMEKVPLQEANVYLGTYIACFNHSEEESIPLWNMYTTRGNGVRIEFEFKENKIHTAINGIFESSCPYFAMKEFSSFIHDIEYSEKNKIEPVFKEGDVYVDVQAVAFEKNNIWKYENETRLMMFTGKRIDGEMPTFIDFQLDFEKIKRIMITFDPWMTEEIKQSIKLTTQFYLKEYSHILEYKNSDLEGRIR